MRNFHVLFVLTAVLALTNTSTPLECRKPNPMTNFNISAYLGDWYQISNNHIKFEEGCDCFTTQLVLFNTSSIKLSNCCQMSKVSNTTQNCEVGVKYLTLVNPENKEAFFVSTRFGSSAATHVWIVDTDYEKYSIGNGCDADHGDLFWIFSRDKELTKDVIKIIEDILKLNNLEGYHIKRQNHGEDVCKTKRPHGHGSKRE
jgi:lipocalin